MNTPAAGPVAFNGIDAVTGRYLPAPSVAELCGALKGEPATPVAPLLLAKRNAAAAAMGLPFDVDSRKLDQSGWGLLLAHGAGAAEFEALAELRLLREGQAGARYKVFQAASGYRNGDSVAEWLGRQGAEQGMPQVAKVPYYLLIVGSPQDIPFDFQYELGVNYAVGRIHFDTIEEYRHYAASVVAGEAIAETVRPRRACFFGVRNDDDRATEMSSQMLVAPLADALQAKHADWTFDRVLAGDATKAGLAQCLSLSPSLLFTASHGMAFPEGHAHQLGHQGALLCQDWQGPLRHRGAIDPGLYFAGEDVADDANLSGSVVFHFACYGAGTPQHDDFAAAGARPRIAPAPFLSHLPQRLLGKPGGGALAVIGHVERAWSYSFASPDFGAQTATFEMCLHALMSGIRIGAAMDAFAMRHAALAVNLNRVLDNLRHEAKVDDYQLASLWTVHHDACNYVILGDPAARIVA
ncbi:MAG TPA: hypothetical protein VGC74_12110 [Stenotrophomonas sp.]|jgi:hypothetical protein